MRSLKLGPDHAESNDARRGPGRGRLFIAALLLVAPALLQAVSTPVRAQTTTAPGAPTGLTASALAPDRIYLAWDTPGDDGGAAIAGYKIEISANNSTWSTHVANTSSTDTFYTDASRSLGDTRYYRVSAINSAGTGTASNVADATTSSALTSSPPTNLTVTARGPTTIFANWDAPAYTGGGVLYYFAHVLHDDGVTDFTTGFRTGGTSFTFGSSLDYGEHQRIRAETTYQIYVVAYNEDNRPSPATKPVSVTTLPATAPTAPRSLAATPHGPNQINLSWSQPADDRGASITGYRIEVSSNAGTTWSDLVADTASTDTTYPHTGLSLGDTHHYRVSAINSAGTGTASGTASATTVSTTVPDAPTDLTAMAGSSTRIDLSWKAPDNNGGAAITGYRIEVSSNAGTSWSDLVADTASTDTTYAHTGLSAGDTRIYRVSAINSASTGAASGTAGATTPTPPGAPTGLSATADGPNQINLSWNRPADTGGAAITGYRIEVSSNAGMTWSDLVADTDSADTTYPHTGLSLGDTRHYRVSAINSAGTGTASGTASATTSAATAPGRTTGLTASTLGPDRIYLRWNTPAHNGAAITGYKIESSSNAGATWSDLVADTASSAATYIDTSLSLGDTRHYRISAINSAGTGATSNTANATTVARVIPSPPENVTIVAVEPTKVTVAWDPPTFVGGDGLLYFLYAYQNGVEVTVEGAPGSPGTVDRLIPLQTYEFAVVALDGNGHASPLSRAVSATTPGRKPGPPTNLAAGEPNQPDVGGSRQRRRRRHHRLQDRGFLE